MIIYWGKDISPPNFAHSFIALDQSTNLSVGESLADTTLVSPDSKAHLLIGKG